MKMFMVNKEDMLGYYHYQPCLLLEVGSFKSTVKINNEISKVDNQKLFMLERDALDYIRELAVNEV